MQGDHTDTGPIPADPVLPTRRRIRIRGRCGVVLQKLLTGEYRSPEERVHDKYFEPIYPIGGERTLRLLVRGTSRISEHLSL